MIYIYEQQPAHSYTILTSPSKASLFADALSLLLFFASRLCLYLAVAVQDTTHLSILYNLGLNDLQTGNTLALDSQRITLKFRIFLVLGIGIE